MNKAAAYKKDKVKRDEPKYNWCEPRKVRSPYEPYNDPGVDCSNDPGVCDPSQAEELDVNKIIRRAQQTGILPGVNVERVYADVSDAKSYHDALNLILAADEQFMSLDAQLRAKFDNDPAKFMDFVHDPKNEAELVKMGLAHERAPTPQPAAPEAPIADPAASQPQV